jgi:hypothetical protein
MNKRANYLLNKGLQVWLFSRACRLDSSALLSSATPPLVPTPSNPRCQTYNSQGVP